jgi:hypothetical protein
MPKTTATELEDRGRKAKTSPTSRKEKHEKRKDKKKDKTKDREDRADPKALYELWGSIYRHRQTGS